VREYDFVEPAIEKVVYAGYIRPPTSGADPAAIRGRPRIVCSCGGGVGGEQMLSACAQAAAILPEFDFQLVLGPHGALRPGLEAALTDNCTLTRIHTDLTALHQSACVVVTHGGYNSVMESVSGGARILVFHIQGDTRDERIHFEQRLADHYPIRSVPNLNCVAQEIGVEVDRALRWGKAPFDLDFNGLVRIAELLQADTGSIYAPGNPEPLASPARPIGFDSPQVPI
jgi:predicted glycosyltransferase